MSELILLQKLILEEPNILSRKKCSTTKTNPSMSHKNWFSKFFLDRLTSFIHHLIFTEEINGSQFPGRKLRLRNNCHVIYLVTTQIFGIFQIFQHSL